MMEAVTTNAAVIAMRRPSVRMKASSGDICQRSLTLPWRARVNCASHPLHRHRDFRSVLDGLIDHAIAFRQLEQQIELVLRRIGSDLEAQADLLEPNGGFLVDAERAAEIQIA